MTKGKIISPRYQQIAADIASKIVEKRYCVGDKVYTRSTLASQYDVSPETARRAIAILADLQIVEPIKGSGVVIKSYENALIFAKNYNMVRSIKDLKNEITGLIAKQTEDGLRLYDLLKELFAQTKRFNAVSPFVPFEIEVTGQADCLGKSIGESKFWQNTGATIIAIKRDEDILISPGPSAIFKEGDVVYYVGDSDSFDRVLHFIYR